MTRALFLSSPAGLPLGAKARARRALSKCEKMEIKITNTDRLVELAGRKVRIWDGVTADGVRCHLFVASIAAHEKEDRSQFEDDLLSLPRVHSAVDWPQKMEFEANAPDPSGKKRMSISKKDERMSTEEITTESDIQAAHHKMTICDICGNPIDRLHSGVCVVLWHHRLRAAASAAQRMRTFCHDHMEYSKGTFAGVGVCPCCLMEPDMPHHSNCDWAHAFKGNEGK